MANGAAECKKQLQIIQAGKFNFDILEGMCCPGGCLNGPAVVSDAVTTKGRMAKENMNTDKKTIQKSLEIFSFEGVNMHVGDHAE
jgi:ferredoxin hydrogenase large subunit